MIFLPLITLIFADLNNGQSAVICDICGKYQSKSACPANRQAGGRLVCEKKHEFLVRTKFTVNPSVPQFQFYNLTSIKTGLSVSFKLLASFSSSFFF